MRPRLRKIEVQDRDRVRVHYEVDVQGETRYVVVALIGRRVIDVQASDSSGSWIGGTGSDRLTEAVKSRALEEVARVRAYRSIGPRPASWSRRPAWTP